MSLYIRHVANVQHVQQHCGQCGARCGIPNVTHFRERTSALHAHRRHGAGRAKPRILTDTDRSVVEGCVSDQGPVQRRPQGDAVLEDLLCGSGTEKL